jgi:hypothetical protein
MKRLKRTLNYIALNLVLLGFYYMGENGAFISFIK